MTAVVVVAAGPSLTREQCTLIETARAAGKVRVAVVNRSWELLPNADLLYAADGRWWDVYGRRALAEFRGQCWTASNKAARDYGICHVDVRNGAGLSDLPNVVYSGGNGGHQVIGKVCHFCRPDPLILVGYDMQHTGGRRHWHEDYEPRVVDGKRISFGNAGSVSSWIRHYEVLAADLKARGIDVINCTTDTALTCFRRADLAQTLDAL